MKDTSRDRKLTREYLLKTARKRLKGAPMNVTDVEKLVDDIMRGGSFISAVDQIVMDSEYWNS